MQDLKTNLKLPDIWQQKAIRSLKSGRDVVVDAPTGAGKTYIFELFLESGFRKKAIYTVPTRALANDKLIEWRSRGWDVGITTGDLSENLEAPTVVATLETQKQRFLRGDGPEMLVIDEYQMLGDPIRGMNYELTIALAPPQTQLLLLSGTVGNPRQIVQWLRRIGREAVMVRSQVRPVPQEECFLEALPGRVPERVHGFWPRLLAKALMADLGPILVFTTRRRASEALARQISSALPIDETLHLSSPQKRLAGKSLARLLKRRVAFHHSGLTYTQRAGLVEPLAKAGQLRVVVSTTGLAAGVNFSLRSVLVTGREYRSGEAYSEVRPDELLQMFGRAGRRGLDKRGFVLVAPGKPRLNEGRPMLLRRSNQVDWPSLLSVMHSAAEQGNRPKAAAGAVMSRLFSDQRIALGLDEFLRCSPPNEDSVPPLIGGKSINQSVIEMLNSQGNWERRRAPVRERLGNALYRTGSQWSPALRNPAVLKGIRVGSVCKIASTPGAVYGRELPLASVHRSEKGETLTLTKWLHRRMRDHRLRNPKRGLIHRRQWTRDLLNRMVLPLLPQMTGGGRLHKLVEKRGLISARLDFSDLGVFVYLDSKGEPLLNPPQKTRHEEFSFFHHMNKGRAGQARTPAQAWYQLGLIDRGGYPTRRGIVFSFFNFGEGLAVTAALEDESYPVEELAYHLANLRAGHRFSEFESYSSRLGHICQATYAGATFTGYLNQGKPVDYGDGAAEVLATASPLGRSPAGLTNEEMSQGDIERADLEWRSLLNHISNAPPYDWKRWMELKAAAQGILGDSESRSRYANLLPLTRAQTTRYQSFLRFR